MFAVDHFVSEWGFPAVRWVDRIDRFMRPTKEEERWLWVHQDGEQLMTSMLGRVGVVGRWQDFESLSIGSLRDDLSGYELQQLQHMQQKGNVAWTEHHTLNASFGRSGVRRMSTSAYSMTEVRRLHEVLSAAFIDGRMNYEPPLEGVCWKREFERIDDKLTAKEVANLSQLRLTALNVPPKECARIKALFEAPRPAIMWWEPVVTRGAMGFGGVQHHHVARMLSVERGEGPGRGTLLFNSYKPGKDGVVVVKAELALLKGFRVVDCKSTYANALQPLKGVVSGLSIVADFRYGLTLPLTCATFAPGVNGRAELEQLKGHLESLFLPLVGRSLTDEDLDLWQG